MKIIAKKNHGALVITNLDNGEMIDVSLMNLDNLEQLQKLNLNQEDFDLLQMLIIDAKINKIK
jgi:hypothetical protein